METPVGKRRLSPSAQERRADSAERRGWGKLLRNNPFTTRTSVKRRREIEREHDRARSDRCLQVGTYAPDYTGQPMESRSGPVYCMTQSQWSTLQPGERLGCGSFGCAYERPDGRVVKVTTDPSDIAALRAGQGHKRVVKLFAAYKLPSDERNRKFYAAITERLRRPSPQIEQYAATMRNEKRFLRDNFDVARASNGELPFGAKYIMRQHYRESLRKSVCGAFPHSSKSCRRFVSDVIRVHEHLGRRGFNFFDVHPHNIGADRLGTWKFLDVGYSSDGPVNTKKVPVLRGVTARRRFLPHAAG